MSEQCQAEDIDDFDIIPHIVNRHVRRMEIQANHVSADDEKGISDLWDLISKNALHPKRSRTHVCAEKEINFDHTVELFDRIATAFVSARGLLQKLSRNRDWSRWIRRSTSSR